MAAEANSGQSSDRATVNAWPASRAMRWAVVKLYCGSCKINVRRLSSSEMLNSTPESAYTRNATPQTAQLPSSTQAPRCFGSP